MTADDEGILFFGAKKSPPNKPTPRTHESGRAGGLRAGGRQGAGVGTGSPPFYG